MLDDQNLLAPNTNDQGAFNSNTQPPPPQAAAPPATDLPAILQQMAQPQAAPQPPAMAPGGPVATSPTATAPGSTTESGSSLKQALDEYKRIATAMDDNARQRQAAASPLEVQRNLPKPTATQMLQDWVHNFTQLQARNPYGGSLAGQPYEPIEQTRLKQTLAAQKLKLDTLASQGNSLGTQLKNAESIVNVMRQKDYDDERARNAAQANEYRLDAAYMRSEQQAALLMHNLAKDSTWSKVGGSGSIGGDQALKVKTLDITGQPIVPGDSHRYIIVQDKLGNQAIAPAASEQYMPRTTTSTRDSVVNVNGNETVVPMSASRTTQLGGTVAPVATPGSIAPPAPKDAPVTPTASPSLTPASTLGDLIGVYAPPSENDTAKYAATVAKGLGVTVDTPLAALGDQAVPLAMAVARYEDNWRNAASPAMRNNNPGNLEFRGQQGATQDGRWAKFTSPGAGFDALVADLGGKLAQARPQGTAATTAAQQTSQQVNAPAPVVPPASAPPQANVPPGTPGRVLGLSPAEWRYREELGKLSPAGQKDLATLTPIYSQVDDLLKKLFVYRDGKARTDNSIFPPPLADAMLHYSLGMAMPNTPEGDLARSISEFSLSNLQQAGQYLNKSRNFQYYTKVMQHLPNLWTNSGKEIWDRLTESRRNLLRHKEGIMQDEIKGASGASKPTLSQDDAAVYVLISGGMKQGIQAAQEDGWNIYQK